MIYRTVPNMLVDAGMSTIYVCLYILINEVVRERSVHNGAYVSVEPNRVMITEGEEFSSSAPRCRRPP